MPLVVYMDLEKHGTVLFYCILVAYLIHMRIRLSSLISYCMGGSKKPPGRCYSY